MLALMLLSGCANRSLSASNPCAESPTNAQAPPTTTSIERGDHVYVFSANPLANLTYQLDCMAELMPCSTEAFRTLWQTELSWVTEDEERLARWGALRRSYSAFIQRETDNLPPENHLATPARSFGFSLSKRLRVVGYLAGDVETFLSHNTLLTTKKNARELVALISEFSPRFIPWWQETARPVADRFLRDGPNAFDSFGIAAVIERLISFFESDLPSDTFVFHCIVRPKLPGPTSGEQIENHSVVEMRVTSGVVDHLPVMLHELSHYFHYNMQTNRLAALEKYFVDSPDPKAMVAHGFLKEALATAWGNGVVGRKVMSETEFSKLLDDERGLYGDTSIHAVAKALLPIVEQSFHNGTVLSSQEFLDKYLKAVHQALPGPSSAVMVLQEYGAVHAPDFGAAASKLRKALFGWRSIYTPLNKTSIGFLATFPLLSSVLMLKPADLEIDGLETVLGHEHMQAIKGLASAEKSFIYAVPRTAKSYSFVLVAQQSDAMNDLVDRLLDVDEVKSGRLWK